MIIGAVIYVRCTACAGIELYLFSYCTEGVPDGTLQLCSVYIVVYCSTVQYYSTVLILLLLCFFSKVIMLLLVVGRKEGRKEGRWKCISGQGRTPVGNDTAV